MTIRSRILGVLSGLVIASSAQANEQGIFDVTLLGVRAATISFAGDIEGGQYAASGQLRTTGLLRLVSQVSYDAQVQGRVRGGQFQPRLYRESARDSGEQFSAEMRYRGRVPQAKGYAPPRTTTGLDPASQAGTVDVMTTIFAVLRDQTGAGVCDVALQLFDGARRSQVVLTQPEALANGQIRCVGEYRRLQGFSDTAMADQQRFPFTLTYSALSSGSYRVTRVDTQTTFGRASLRRRMP